MSWNFDKELMKIIKEYNGIPKVKVEIPIQLILKLYIEDVMNSMYKLGDEDEKFKLVTVEFPYLTRYANEKMKIPKQYRVVKVNGIRRRKKFDCPYQSKNVDFLLYRGDTLYFVELKTASSSIHDLQLNNYVTLLDNISKYNLLNKILTTDIDDIKVSSIAPTKYDRLKKLMEDSNVDASKMKQAKVVYIVPSDTKNSYANNNTGVDWISLSEVAKLELYKNEKEKKESWAEFSSLIKDIDKDL